MSSCKPNLRGFHRAQSVQNIYKTAAVVVIAVLTFRTLYVVPRRNAYKKYNEIPDKEKWADEMSAAGLLDSMPAPKKK